MLLDCPGGSAEWLLSDRLHAPRRTPTVAELTLAMSTSLRVTLEALFITFLLVTGSSLGCGPGRGSGKRRGPRKRTPLVYKQHIPNVSENTIGASGKAEGRISRDDPRFKDMAQNSNPSIVFKDEERTNDDRIMSKRCKDRLNTLAVAVMNEWHGVKLRVTEAWDADGHHAKDSLHYEGRAVDITTSDRDRSKYGMLARLAVEAGFDWVYYESRSHIHCSVRSDSAAATHYGGCFPLRGRVFSETQGWKTLSDVKIGERVLALGPAGEPDYSDVIAFLDKNPDANGFFYTVETHGGHRLTLTAKHLIFAARSNQTAAMRAIFAEKLQEGDHIMTSAEQKPTTLSLSRVRRITAIVEQGVMAPLTRHGTIVVDGVVVSCYAFIYNPNLAHLAFAPMRAAYDLSRLVPFMSWIDSPLAAYSVGGIHWYANALYRAASLFFSRDSLYVADN